MTFHRLARSIALTCLFSLFSNLSFGAVVMSLDKSNKEFWFTGSDSGSFDTEYDFFLQWERQGSVSDTEFSGFYIGSSLSVQIGIYPDSGKIFDFDDAGNIYLTLMSYFPEEGEGLRPWSIIGLGYSNRESYGFLDPWAVSTLEAAATIGTDLLPSFGAIGSNNIRIELGNTQVPEPTSMAIFGIGFLGFAYRNRRKRKA